MILHKPYKHNSYRYCQNLNMMGLTFFPTVNCGHKKPKALLKEYIAISDSVTAKVIKADECKDQDSK
jgi:hypothetical protein